MRVAGRVDLPALVAELARREAARTEADVQASVRTLLLYGGLNLDDPSVRLETPAPGRRRVDVENGRTVIECKKDLSVGNVRSEAVERTWCGSKGGRSCGSHVCGSSRSIACSSSSEGESVCMLTRLGAMAAS